ncbi:Uncharacterized protein HZ326_18451 [Fusarium oxysporum f. sp. albedinis]|nr:Uncharacterized protein HZ326_18451 [Fusarium oxysporum f. sp. albedinis]
MSEDMRLAVCLTCRWKSPRLLESSTDPKYRTIAWHGIDELYAQPETPLVVVAASQTWAESVLSCQSQRF